MFGALCFLRFIFALMWRDLVTTFSTPGELSSYPMARMVAPCKPVASSYDLLALVDLHMQWQVVAWRSVGIPILMKWAAKLMDSLKYHQSSFCCRPAMLAYKTKRHTERLVPSSFAISARIAYSRRGGVFGVRKLTITNPLFTEIE